MESPIWMVVVLANVAGFLLLFMAYKFVKRIFKLLYEATLLYTVAFAHKTHSETAPSKRLIPFTVPIKILSEEDIEEIYKFAKKFVDGEYSIEQQIQILRNFDYICFFRDRVTGRLMGTLTYAIEDRETGGRKFTVVKSGMAYFERSCTGGSMFLLCVLLPCLWLLTKHPTRPVYLMTWTFSYMSYLYMVKNTTIFYPRHDCLKVPEFEQSLLDEFGSSLSSTYNNKTFVAPRTVAGRLKPKLSTVPESVLSSPHVKFFIENNPGYAEGDGMVVCGKLTWKTILILARGVLSRAMNPPKDRSAGQVKRSYKRFVSEAEYLENKGSLAKRLSDLALPEVPVSPTLEESTKTFGKRLPFKRPKPFVNTKSILMGVDRIDEYSQMDIPL